MLHPINNIIKAIYIFVAMNAFVAFPIAVNEDNNPTTGDYKDELFNAMFSIYKIMKNHDQEQQLIQIELPQKQSSEENLLQDLPSNAEGKTINTFENTDSFTNELAGDTQGTFQDNELDESSENAGANDLSYVGKRIIVQKKHQLNRKRKEILKGKKIETSKHKTKNKNLIKNIQAVNFRNGKFSNSLSARSKPSSERNELQRKKYLNRLPTTYQQYVMSNDKYLKRKRGSMLNQHNYLLKVHKNVNNTSKVIKNDVIKLNNNYDAIRENLKEVTTSSFKYLARDNAKTSRKQDTNLDTENTKDYTLLDALNAVKKVSHRIQPRRNPKRQQNHRVSRIIHLKNKENYHPKLEAFTEYHSEKKLLFPKHIINGSKHDVFPFRKISLNDNYPAAVTKNENVASENERNFFFSSLDKNVTDINETDSSSLSLVEHGLSIKKFEVGGVAAKRKDRFVTENSGNHSEFNWQVFLKNVAKSGFSYILEHKTAAGVISLITVIILIVLVVMISICCKTKRRRYEAEKEYLPLKTSDSVSNDDSVAFKKRATESRSLLDILKKGRKQQKYTPISSDLSKNNSNENNNTLYSISGETDEDEENQSVEDNSYMKKPMFSKNYHFIVQNVKQQELQQDNEVLKTTEYSHSKLQRLHKNLSVRTGNVCYTDALKNSKRKPNAETAKPSRKRLMKKNSPYDPYLYESNVQSCDFFKKDKINTDFENFSISQDENDDKYSELTKRDEIFEEFDPSNPFYEHIDVNN